MIRTALHRLLIIMVGLVVFTICTVITPYWGVVAVLLVVTNLCFRWEHFTQGAVK